MSSSPASAADTRFFGHPRALGTLFFTELWERFSYYGMCAILILFMTAPEEAGGMGFDVANAAAIYGLYTGMVYLACLPGGWLADQVIGARRATLVGGSIIMLGHLCLAWPSHGSFYVGLVFIVTGTGLLKPNVSTLVGQLYEPADRRRDAGFSLYYMGINSGAFLAPLVCGALAQGEGFRALLSSAGIAPQLAWHFGFGAAALGMALGLLSYLRGSAWFGLAGLPPPPSPARSRALQYAWRGATVLAVLGAAMASLSLSGSMQITAAGLGNAFGLLLLAITVAFFAWIFTRDYWSTEERRRLWMVLALFLGATAFWSLYEQGGSTLTLFAERNTDTTVLGYSFPSSWMQSLNPIFIICGLAPAFAWLWPRLGKNEPSSPAKFAIGLAFMAAGYAVMVLAGSIAQSGVRVSPLWLVVMYFLHTLGEMCLSPVGLSAMTRLAPARVASLTMGVWFLASSIGSYLGGRVAGLYDSLELAQIFGALTVFAVLAAVLMAVLAKPLQRLLQASSRR